MSAESASKAREQCRSTAIGLLIVLMTAASGTRAGAPADCVDIDDDAGRLACYDRAHGRRAVVPAERREAIAGPESMTAPAATLPPPAVAPMAVIPGPAAPARVPVTDAFGKTSVPVAPVASATDSEPDRIEARVVGKVEGPARGQELVLDNSQLWRNIDDREFDYLGDSPQVTLWRNLIGSYWLRFEPSGPQLRVRRVK